MNELAKFLYEMGQLKRVARTGWSMVGVERPESVADHSFRVAIVGYALAQLEGADPWKTAVMCLFHDVPEARINDLHRVGQAYLDWQAAQERAWAHLLERVPGRISEELASLMSEYRESKSLEAKLAHDADQIEFILQACEYRAQGHGDVADWITANQARLITEPAKKLAQECLAPDARQWWKDLKLEG